MRRFQKTKGFILGILAATLAFSLVLPVMGVTLDALVNFVNIRLNGELVGERGEGLTLANGDDVPYSIVYKGTTYVPLATLGRLLDKDIVWDSGTRTVLIDDRRPNQTPRVRLVEQPGLGKVYVPLEFMGEPSLREIKEDLPVITIHRYKDEDIYFRYGRDLETVFDKMPEYVFYTLYDECFNEVYSRETFEMPSQVGDYILWIDTSWAGDGSFVYLIRFVVGEPRELCRFVNWHHGGGYGLFLEGGFNKLLEIHSLLEQDDKAIRDYFSALCAEHDRTVWLCPCYIQTRADLQNLFSWLRLNELRLPFSDNVPLRSISIGDQSLHVLYTIDDMLFNFYMSPPNYGSTLEELMEVWANQGDEMPELLTVNGDVRIYIGNRPDCPSVSFSISVNGTHVGVHVTIPCAIPDTCDRGDAFGGVHSCNGEQVDKLAAIKGILQFDFRTLF
jgi:hypothetical protein